MLLSHLHGVEREGEGDGKLWRMRQEAVVGVLQLLSQYLPGGEKYH
jgi:hypothetical protein